MAAKTAPQKAAPAQAQAGRQDNRIHSAVYHKSDPRVNELIRKHRKSDIVNLYNVDCYMLFRVEQAHMQFDMLQNYRPYILFDGTAEAVFLPIEMGLLFPNACDQLDFRKDKEVPVRITYALSDLEISVLAGNGLFNGDWSCQGKILNSVLEIPCKIDYYAVSRTPITFVEIRDRLSMHTSTMQTGYKTLAAAFLPYQAQKHNMEQVASLTEGPKFSMDKSEIRRRGEYDLEKVGFGVGPDGRTMADGASFVEVAQARIKKRLAEQMQKGDVLGVQGGKQPEGTTEADGKAVAAQVAATVDAIKKQSQETREKAAKEAAASGSKLKAADIDARLNDLAQHMVYAGAEAIPMEAPKLKAEPLVSPGPAPEGNVGGLKPETKCDPVPPEVLISDKDDKIRHAVMDSKKTADDITGSVKTAMSRKDKLAAMRAAKAENKPGGGTGNTAKPAAAAEAPSSQGVGLDDDILSGNVDIDALLKSMEG